MIKEIISTQTKLNALDTHVTKTLQPSIRSLADSLQSQDRGFIFECKRSSPSMGRMVESYCPVTRAQILAPFSAAISVLTNSTYFEGSYEDLQAVASSVDIPVICKDFIISPSQVKKARSYGADAVLLMLCLLDDEHYKTCAQVAQSLQMDIITEVHTEAELTRALKLGANIIGLNHRDFKTLKVDFSPTIHLAQKIPDDIIVISESGIQDFADIKQLSAYTKHFLIGSILKDNPAHMARTIRYGNIKVCGLTTKQDAETAYQSGALMGGLNFVPSSQRYIAIEQAKSLVQVPLQWVGVFQDELVDVIVQVQSQLNLSAIQLHGQESKATIEQLKQRLPSHVQIIKAICIDELHLLDKLDCHFLLDSKTSNAFGGTGVCAPITPTIAKHAHRMILAGGIGPDNIQAKLPFDFMGFDINSKVETAPGIKDCNKLSEFFKQIDRYRSAS